jgi:hypothetical protein
MVSSSPPKRVDAQYFEQESRKKSRGMVHLRLGNYNHREERSLPLCQIFVMMRAKRRSRQKCETPPFLSTAPLLRSVVVVVSINTADEIIFTRQVIIILGKKISTEKTFQLNFSI